MKVGTTLRIAACGIAGLGACATPSQTGSSRETVRALRYRVEVFEGTLAFNHHAEEWIEELYFPEQGIACNVVKEWGVPPEAEREHLAGWRPPPGLPHFRPRMNAFFGSMEERRQPSRPGREPEAAEPPVDVLVPEDLARAIFRLAEASRRDRESQLELGLRVAKGGWLTFPELGPGRTR
ncbi:MAG TPA: hypothetical protein VFI25_17535 [Planctomycetota bacterium]|jgi:hypothetical protein|nr:hypothetical protein [Planctomycetota bacterium]